MRKKFNSKVLFLSIFLTVITPFTPVLSATAVGPANGGGGHPIALEFIESANRAVNQLEISIEQKIRLFSVIKETHYYVTDKDLNVIVKKGGKPEFQKSTVVNVPSEKTIFIQRNLWKEITSERIRQKLAEHEIRSLLGEEKTGRYDQSGSDRNANYDENPDTLKIRPPGFKTTITVLGKPISEYRGEYGIFAFSVGSNEQPIVNSRSLVAQRRKLGDATPVEGGGAYIIAYEGMLTQVRVPDDVHYKFQIQAVQFPLDGGLSEFKIYLDYTSPIEQQKVTNWQWAYNSSDQCEKIPETSPYKEYCNMKKNRNYLEFKTFIEMNLFGPSCTTVFCKENSPTEPPQPTHRDYVFSGDSTNDTFALLPGAYRAEFKNKYGDVQKINFIVPQ